jgi:phage baseplate assembly protein W
MLSKAISLPFSFDNFGSVGYSRDEKKIWQDRVVMVVMTRLGERIMRPTFGTAVGSTIFENVNDAIVLIEQAVSGAFTSFLSPLILTKVKASVDPLDGYVVIEITYRYNRAENEQSLKIKTAVFSRTGELVIERPQDGR